MRPFLLAFPQSTLRAVLVATLFCLSLHRIDSLVAAEQPNSVVLMADDLGDGDHSP